MKKVRPRVVKETIPAKHVYTGLELQEMGQRLATNNQKVRELEDAKKETVSDYKARIDAVESEIHVTSQQLTKGYEMRPTRCVVKFFAKKQVKKFYTEVGNKLVATRPMTQADFATEFPFGEEASPATPPEGKQDEPPAPAKKPGPKKKGKNPSEIAT